MYQQCQKIRLTDFISEIRRVENYPDLEKLVHLIHLIYGFKVKSRRQVNEDKRSQPHFEKMGLLRI